MAGLGFGNVAFVGSLGGATAPSIGAPPAGFTGAVAPASGAELLFGPYESPNYFTTFANFLQSNGFGPWPTDGIGAYSFGNGMATANVFAAAISLLTLTGYGVNGATGMRITRLSDLAVVFNQSFAHVGPDNGSQRLTAVLPLDTYQVELYDAADGGMGFDEIAIRR